MKTIPLALERGDKATVQLYLRQFEKQHIPVTPRSQNRPAETQVSELRQPDRITRRSQNPGKAQGEPRGGEIVLHPVL